MMKTANASTLIYLSLTGLMGGGAITTGNQGKDPVKVDLGENGGTIIVALAAAAMYSLFLGESHQLWATGKNSEGQMGSPNTTIYKTPIKILGDVHTVSAGYDHSLFLMQDGTLWVTGSQGSGQLGIGSGRTNTAQFEKLVFP